MTRDELIEKIHARITRVCGADPTIEEMLTDVATIQAVLAILEEAGLIDPGATDETKKKEEVMTQQQRFFLIQEVFQKLSVLQADVCPQCAKGESVFCEVVDGVTQHVSGACLASPVRRLKTHVDDVRDQFANEFNEEQIPRAIWSYEMNPEHGNPTR
jgi:hypothetical protein